jgi:hypothetical protein
VADGFSKQMDEMAKSPKGLPRRRTAAFWGVCCLGGVLVLFAAGAVIPCSMVSARPMAQKNACVNNLRMLDGAKEEWSLEKKAGKGAVVTMADITAGENPLVRAVPMCPGGGEYSVGVVGELPKCTLGEKGHRL